MEVATRFFFVVPSKPSKMQHYFGTVYWEERATEEKSV